MPLWSQTRMENDKKDEGGSGIEGSGRTFFDKKELPLGFMCTNHNNSKVTHLVSSLLKRNFYD
jgi:hypothetical protein